MANKGLCINSWKRRVLDSVLLNRPHYIFIYVFFLNLKHKATSSRLQQWDRQGGSFPSLHSSAHLLYHRIRLSEIPQCKGKRNATTCPVLDIQHSFPLKYEVANRKASAAVANASLVIISLAFTAQQSKQFRKGSPFSLLQQSFCFLCFVSKATSLCWADTAVVVSPLASYWNVSFFGNKIAKSDRISRGDSQAGNGDDKASPGHSDTVVRRGTHWTKPVRDSHDLRYSIVTGSVGIFVCLAVITVLNEFRRNIHLPCCYITVLLDNVLLTKQGSNVLAMLWLWSNEYV